MVDSPGEGWSCPAQLQELGEDVTEGQPAWAASCSSQTGPAGLLQTASKSAGITELREDLLLLPQLPCWALKQRLFRVARSPCGYCTWLFHTRHSCGISSSKSPGTEASLSSSAASTLEHLQHWFLEGCTSFLSLSCSVLGISSVFPPLLAGKTDFTSMQRHYQKISLPSQWKHLKSITDVERENVLPSWKTEFGSKLLADIIITSLS